MSVPKAQVQALIAAKRATAFPDPSQASDAEALGLLVAEWADWDGATIIEALSAALEDANYHTLAGAIEDLLRQDAEEQAVDHTVHDH